METSLSDYFELEETDKAEQAASLSTEDSPIDEPALTEEDSSPEETAPTDDSTPLTDADLTESDPPADETERAAMEDNAGDVSITEGAASYTAPEQTGVSGTETSEKPPEEPIQDTQ